MNQMLHAIILVRTVRVWKMTHRSKMGQNIPLKLHVVITKTIIC